MGLNDVSIIKGKGGIGRLEPNVDNVRGLVMNAGAIAPTGLAVNIPKQLLQLLDAENVGINKAYDTTNDTLCWYHIKEFFAENPTGKLWLMLVPTATTLTQMADGTAATPSPVERLAMATNGECLQYGIARNPAVGYTPTITAGIDADVTAAVPKAQVLMDKLFANHMPSDIIIEGRSFTGTASAAANLRALASTNVRVVIAQDLDVAPAAATAIRKAHAAVGTILGTSSKARVSDNIGWVEQYNLASVAFGRWINCGLSSNLPIVGTAYTSIDLDTLNTLGYIFVRKFVGESGSYWNDSHSCCEATSDYYCMENVLVINKAVRGVYKALLPKVNSPVKVNAAGQLPSEVVVAYESIGARPIETMRINEEVSEFAIYINPFQNIITQSKLNAKINIVPIGTARNIEVEIGYVQKLA
jgi:hypothetical protein